jgi:hypothetical protein
VPTGGGTKPALTQGECEGLGGKVAPIPVGGSKCSALCELADKNGTIRSLCIDNVVR